MTRTRPRPRLAPIRTLTLTFALTPARTPLLTPSPTPSPSPQPPTLAPPKTHTLRASEKAGAGVPLERAAASGASRVETADPSRARRAHTVLGEVTRISHCLL